MSEWVVVDRWWPCPGVERPSGYPEAELAVYGRWRVGVVCREGERWAYQVRLLGAGVPDVDVPGEVLRSWSLVRARRVDLLRVWLGGWEVVEFVAGDVLERVGQGLGYLEFLRRYGSLDGVGSLRVVGLRADAVVWGVVGGRLDVSVEVLGG